MATVTASHVYKIYPGDKEGGDVTAVEDLNVEIADREFVVLVGPPDCGKSTTLRMIAGLEEISRGDIYIGDRRVNGVPAKDREIAMVFQNYALYPHMSVYDNMAFGLKLRKFAKPEIKRRVNDAASILGIENLFDRKPKSLSGEQRHRVAVGRAIVRQPKVILFDEPLSNLDAGTRVQMRTEITTLHQRLQATTIYVTHDQIEAMSMGDRVVVMNNGRLQQNDTPLKLYHEPDNLFVAGFLGSPPMNFIHGEVRSGRGGVVFKEINDGTIEVNLNGRDGVRELAGKPVLLGVRPEDIEIAQFSKPAETVASFPAIVDIVEPIGPETYLYLQTGAHAVICRSQRALDRREAGRRLRFELDVRKVHFFDPATSLRIP